MRKIISVMLIFLHLTFGIVPTTLLYNNAMSGSRFYTILYNVIGSHLSLADEYRLAPGDVLEVKIVGQDKLDTKQTITPDGTISLPMLGRLIASGLTLKQLDSVLASGFSKYINKPQVVVYLTPRPIYVVQHDQGKNTWDVKEAKSVAEAQAYMGSSTSDIGHRTSDIGHGQVISVEAGNKPDWWEQNWYKIITATAVIAGVYATVHR